MISFKDTQLALIHIPLHLYSSFLQTILQLLLPNESRNGVASNGNGSVQPPKGWPYEHPFVNISITPVECSVVCSRRLAREIFVPARDALSNGSKKEVAITDEDFVVMQVDGEGLAAGQRVLELTSPLALAGIGSSIFFITTYFSDYILVPLRYRIQVVQALEDRGFRFEDQISSYVNPIHHGRKHSSTSSFDAPPPGTPPPATISELQTRTFATLKRRNIVPTVDEDLRLVQCAGRRDGENGMHQSRNRNSMTSAADDALHLGLVKCLITPPFPRFLSLTLTDTEPASLLLDHTLLPNFTQDILLGSKDDYLIPITLDLRDLPMESTGIVCGVAGRLVGGTSGQLEHAVEMSYLSTARAGTVMVGEDELRRALGALRGAENGALSTPD
ncbi:hypothetical protein K491DRAFT_682968 [Lophiostoma macrostomum CBS 122681]|uniref:CASTOR ACT domain-containing protein n=1 Tax=Lophiostoma macrostomum CBS 122681 TaxID=1314788 RepID=A0A6A6STX4_9PLEO|nr:hypothetical protein K491DRAFT_682968 [Lophiostoma macrostomum CBS 122681]